MTILDAMDGINPSHATTRQHQVTEKAIGGTFVTEDQVDLASQSRA